LNKDNLGPFKHKFDKYKFTQMPVFIKFGTD